MLRTMPILKILGSVAVLAAILAAVAAYAHPTIDIVASNWKFTPAKITVPVNEETTLNLTSTSGVHGIKSDDLKISDTTISPGKFVLVKFTPTKAGTYVVHCSVVCGPGHPDMALTIVVTAALPSQLTFSQRS
jgi:cytochrome c oxidase subunit 2